MWGNIKLGSNLRKDIQFYQIQISENNIQLNHFGYQQNRKQNGWIYGQKGINKLNKNYDLNKWHHIQIQQFNSELIIYRDKIEIFRTKIQPIKGNMIGIQNCLKNEIQIDNLTIREIKNPIKIL